jgi:hypothetical protein
LSAKQEPGLAARNPKHVSLDTIRAGASRCSGTAPGASAGAICIVMAPLDGVLALGLLLLARRSARGPHAPYLPHFTETLRS